MDHASGIADTRCNVNETKYWECGRNKRGHSCIEFKTYSHGAKLFWSLLGGMAALVVAIVQPNRMDALIRAWDTRSSVTYVAAIGVGILFVIIIGWLWTFERKHAVDYAMLTFGGPVSVYIALQTLLRFFGFF